MLVLPALLVLETPTLVLDWMVWVQILADLIEVRREALRGHV